MSSGHGGRGKQTSTPSTIHLVCALPAVAALLLSPAPVAAWADAAPVAVPSAPTGSWTTGEIDASPGVDELCERSSLATGNGGVAYAVATDHPQWPSTDKQTVRFARSVDGGATWTSQTRLSEPSTHSGGPALASSGQVVHAVWGQGIPTNYHSSVVVRTNTAAGAADAWRPGVRLTSATGRVGVASIATSGRSVYVAVTRMGAWNGSGDGEVLLFTSRDVGRTWSRRTLGVVGSSKSRQSTSRPTVVATDRAVVVAWVRTARQPSHPTEYSVLVRTSRDAGRHFSAATVIGRAKRVVLDGIDGRVTVASHHSTLPRIDIWLRTWRDGRWQPRRVLPFETAAHLAMALRTSGRIGMLVDPRATEHDPDVLEWVESSDGGRTWGSADVLPVDAEELLCAARWTPDGRVLLSSAAPFGTHPAGDFAWGVVIRIRA